VDGFWLKTIRTTAGDVVKVASRGEVGITAAKSTLCVVWCVYCVCCARCVCFVFRMCCVCVCVKVKFTMSENHPTGRREEAKGGEEEKEERDDKHARWERGGERETTNFVVNTRMKFARTHTDK
jgi:hypothetical protein